jgi:tetratricopeptide (TPR) repeat protein
MAYESLIQNEGFLGNFTATLQAAEAGLRLAEAHDSQWGIAHCLYWQGMTHLFVKNDYEMAAQIGRRCVEVVLKTGETWMIACVLGNLQGGAAIGLQNYAEARELLKQALNLFAAIYQLWGIAMMYNQLGIVAFLEGDYSQANLYFQQALHYRMEDGNVATMLPTLGGWSKVLVKLGGLSQAVTLLTCILKYPSYPHFQDEVRALLNDLRNQLDTAKYAQAVKRGNVLEIHSIVQELLEEFGEKDT